MRNLRKSDLSLLTPIGWVPSDTFDISTSGSFPRSSFSSSSFTCSFHLDPSDSTLPSPRVFSTLVSSPSHIHPSDDTMTPELEEAKGLARMAFLAYEGDIVFDEGVDLGVPNKQSPPSIEIGNSYGQSGSNLPLCIEQVKFLSSK
ncbi:hypothetical protein PIB30_042685 [Stylosanthes scabra]|uniref:Uncharacterized protein n=1 Tax=Stylosanthes scabra TaxID=79078 RepID=A0ABU6VEB8_9FABA|nr:hypothetical protein [Stylosanthes scabra]